MPTLLTIPTVPTQILAAGEYALTQGTGNYSVNASLTENLSRLPSVQLVSPEVLALSTLDGQPVLLRGANASLFLAMARGTWDAGGSGSDTWAAAGASLAARLRLAMGDAVTLAGSGRPRLDIVRITGVYRTGGVADDELLVDLATARFLTGVPPGIFHVIRVRTTDPAALLAYLRTSGASVVVTGPGGPAGGANTAPTTDPRLINLYLLHGTGALPADYLTEGLNEATGSIRVVTLGIAALLGVLAVAAIHAVQARTFADRRAAVGTLRAVGASSGWLGFRVVRETLPLTTLAALLGTGAGFLLASSLAATSTVLVFGHAVRVEFDVPLFAILVAANVLAGLGSQLFLVRGAIRDRPGESLREAVNVEPPASLEVVLRG